MQARAKRCHNSDEPERHRAAGRAPRTVVLTVDGERWLDILDEHRRAQ